ncbi:hypothetical protein HNR46_003049 [Haloferula luteola]|uniref:Uncharacterized protein n=1 Tax=Haloferula luteola TaxID=595692 RepID=A0A840VJD0_9BACT|nr:hypothetical protein [Haloferula luteola]MBB5352801.1 hypothetical protein [Haloferula luteola]
MKSPVPYIVGISLSLMSLSAMAQEEPPAAYQEVSRGEAGGWTITTFSQDGKTVHAMMERSNDDGTLFRYFLGDKVSTFMFFDNKVFPAFPENASSALASYSFSGVGGGDTPALPAAASLHDGLTNGQDAMVRIDVDENTDFLATLVEAKALHVTIRDYSRTFDLKGSKQAADALLKWVGGDAVEGEIIALTADSPSVVWDLHLNGGESKVYQIQGKKGQKMKLSFIEDTRDGMIDVGKASVEEGLDKAMTLTFDRDDLQRVDVTNPSTEAMDFRIYLSVE